MRDLKNISSELFDKIRTRFDKVRLGDDKSKATTDPEVARFFNFDYAVDGHKVGNITISLIDEQSLKLYYGRDIVEAIKEIDDNPDLYEEMYLQPIFVDYQKVNKFFDKDRFLNWFERNVYKGVLNA